MTETKLALTLSFAFLSGMIGGCSGADEQPKIDTSTRDLKGTVDVTQYALDNGVVVAQSRAGHTVLAPIGARGEFKLTLPASETYRLLIANTTRSGRYEVLSRVLFSTAAPGIKPQSSGSGKDGSGSGGDSSSSSSSSESAAPSSADVCGGATATESAHADLPYDAKIPLGAQYRLSDSFREKGALPVAILDVKSDGGSWRLQELISNTAFVVSQADCDHAGNRDVGRDRVFVTWKNHDGSVETDHLDMRYCEGDVAPSALAQGAASGGTSASSSASSSTPCDDDDAHVCKSTSTVDSKPSHDCEGLEPTEVADQELASCPSAIGGTTASGSVPATGSASASGAAPAGSGAVSGGSVAWIIVRPGTIGDLGVIRPMFSSAGAGAVGGASAGSATSGAAGATNVGGTSASATGGTFGSLDVGMRCAVSADCRTGLSCIASKCMVPIK